MPANTLKSEPANTSPTSKMRSGLRRSGLSVPKLSSASAKGMRGNGKAETLRGVSRLNAANSWNTPPSTGSIASNTSSWVTKLISKSSW